MTPEKTSQRKRATIITTIVFVVMMLVPIALVMVYYNTYNNLTKQETTNEQTLSDIASLALKVKLDSLVSIATSLSSSPDLITQAQKGNWEGASNVARDMENNVAYYDPFIDRVSIYDASGTQQAAYPALTGGLGNNASSSDWYKSLSTGAKTSFVTNVSKRLSLPRIQVISIAAPIRSQSGLIGFLVLQIPTDNFLEFGEQLTLGNYGFTYIVDSMGNIVAHPKLFSDNSSVINYSFVPEVQEIINGNSGVDISYDNNSKEKSVVTYKVVNGYGWGIITQELYSEAFATRSDILGDLALMISVITLINALIAYIVFRFLSSEHKHGTKK